MDDATIEEIVKRVRAYFNLHIRDDDLPMWYEKLGCIKMGYVQAREACIALENTWRLQSKPGVSQIVRFFREYTTHKEPVVRQEREREIVSSDKVRTICAQMLKKLGAKKRVVGVGDQRRREELRRQAVEILDESDAELQDVPDEEIPF